MKRKDKKAGKPGKAGKGMSSAVLLSILIHAGLFLLAGMLVVFTVVKKEDKKFEPPKAVERPKMKLRKPKVKPSKSSKPKSTTRIVTRVNRTSMPDIQLPEMSGMGDGLGGGLGDGFSMMPDLGELTVFGSAQAIGNDFIGTFYDLKRRRDGSLSGVADIETVSILANFVKSGWKESHLSKYYSSPKKLYATCFMIPTLISSLGPMAFDEADTVGWCWAAHYKGQLVHKDAITFRFWGQGDDVLVVRVDGKIVLNGSWPGGTWNTQNVLSPTWQSSGTKSRMYRMGNNLAEVGDWITLEPGVPLPMEVLLGEVPGGHFDAMLVVEVKGGEYERNRQGGPILPMFTTEIPSHEILDAIIPILMPGEASLTNGPVFKDY